jgi:hypothetical protein
MLKTLTYSGGQMNKLCAILMKTCLTLEGQQTYQTLLELRLEKKKDDRPSQFLGEHDAIEENFILWSAMFQYVQKLPSLSFFPIFMFEKESKMKWCYMPTPDQSTQDKFRLGFQSFLAKYAPREVFAPPPQATWKSGGSRFNDGGTVRFDFERAEDYDSWFKYQKFVTQPLSIREVWLPGKGVKQNSSYWFEITRPILARIPYSLLGLSSLELTQRVKMRTKGCGSATTYDFYGFGLQFVREYLAIAMEEIAYLYPNFLISEAAEIGISKMRNVVLEQDGKFTYPPRGIGLGYYETLKTLCIMSILDKYDPILIWGDEGLLRSNRYAEAISEVESYGFYFNHEKQKHYDGHSTMYWGGFCITPDRGGVSTPFKYTQDIPALFRGKTHWERKANSNTLRLESSSGYSRLAYVYERTFGYEFHVGESLKNPLNGGVNRRAPIYRGWVPTANVERYRSLGQRTYEDMRYEMPVSIVKKHANRMDFARKRKQEFRKPIVSTYTRDYMFPKMIKGLAQKPKVSPLAQHIPPWMEKRMMLYNGILSEKFTRGLSYEQMLKAALEFCYSEDPFDLASRKGSRCEPLFHRPEFLSEDWEDLIDKIKEMKKVSDYATLRADLMTPLEREAKFIQQAAILAKRRTDAESKDRINRIVFGNTIKEALDFQKRKRETPELTEQEEPEEDEPRQRIRYGSEDLEEPQGLLFEEESFYEGISPDVLFIEEEPDRCLELVFGEDQFYPSLP